MSARKGCMTEDCCGSGCSGNDCQCHNPSGDDVALARSEGYDAGFAAANVEAETAVAGVFERWARPEHGLLLADLRRAIRSLVPHVAPENKEGGT